MDFLCVTLGTLCASLLENLFSGKEMKVKREVEKVVRSGDGVIQAAKGAITAGQNV